MKLFLIFTIFFCCVLIGILIKKYYEKRQTFFCDLCLFTQNLSSDISYNNEKLLVILNRNEKLFNSDINYLFSNFSNYINNKISVEEFEKNVNKKFNYLHEKEKFEVINFFTTLGNFAKEEELQKITNFLNLIENFKIEALEKNKKFSSLYFKLFLFLGITFVVVFI